MPKSNSGKSVAPSFPNFWTVFNSERHEQMCTGINAGAFRTASALDSSTSGQRYCQFKTDDKPQENHLTHSHRSTLLLPG